MLRSQISKPLQTFSVAKNETFGYHSDMRRKDENKKAAITKAIVGLMNEMGFANTSMAKIANATGLSAATLYVYYENKEEMFRQVYLDVKKRMIAECSRNISPQENVQDAVRTLCENLLRYMQNYTDEFLFIEQACNSPMVTDSMAEELAQYHRDTIQIFQRGIREGLLKQTSPALLIRFCYYPIQQIFKEWRQAPSTLPEVDFDVVFQMCWDAIKR